MLILLVLSLSLTVFVAEAISKDELNQNITIIDNQVDYLKSINMNIKNSHKDLINNKTQEVLDELSSLIKGTFTSIVEIKQKLVDNDFDVPNTEGQENVIKILPNAYSSNVNESSNRIVDEKYLEVEEIANNFTETVENLRNDLGNCTDDDESCLLRIYRIVFDELCTINRTVNEAGNYNKEIDINISECAAKKLKLGEKELDDFNQSISKTLLAEPVDIVSNLIKKNITNLRGNVDKSYNRYMIDVLFDYRDKPISEAINSTIKKLQQMKTYLKNKNESVVSEDESNIDKANECFKGIEIIDEMLESNFTELKSELGKTSSTFVTKTNKNMAKIKQLKTKIQRYIDSTAPVNDTKIFEQLDEVETKLHMFNDEFLGYNTFISDLEEYKVEFKGVVKASTKEVDELVTKVASCLNDLNAGVSLGSFSLLMVILIAISNIKLL